jgi:hypothetical protein
MIAPGSRVTQSMIDEQSRRIDTLAARAPERYRAQYDAHGRMIPAATLHDDPTDAVLRVLTNDAIRALGAPRVQGDAAHV